jgi:DNA-binding SARP family transcriptional activator
MNIGSCGTLCTFCRYFARGLCTGCGRGDLCPPEESQGSPCSILRCAAASQIPYCARDCPDFPCALTEARFPRGRSWIAPGHLNLILLDEGSSAGSLPPVTAWDIEGPERSGLRVFCLGTFRVHRGLEEIPEDEWGRGKGPTQKIKALLAYLLSRKKRGARKETLIDLLWPEQKDYAQASACFHLALHYLRRALEPDLSSGRASSYIRYRRQRYRFDPQEPCWIDADVFEAYGRRAQARVRNGDPEAAMIDWAMALDLYGGDYMAGVSIDYTENPLHGWCIARRRYLRESFLTGLLVLGSYHCQTGAHDLGLKYAREALAVEPALERAHRLTMRCLIEDGRPDEAVHQYHKCRGELTYYESREPAKETILLYEQLLRESERA